jgi:translation elongation factor EF-1alpha
VYDLHKELAVLFSDKGEMEFEDSFSQEGKLNETAYLADMFGLLNQMNVCLQGHNLCITDSCDKI